jgi:hypothetical protein
VLEEKDTYSIQELFENLDISIRELSRVSDINEVTLARIRDGKPTHKSTANKLLKTLSTIYDRPFYLRKVTGINFRENKRLARKQSQEAKNAA